MIKWSRHFPMVNTVVLIVYGVLMVAFLAIAGMALRHTAKFAYISRGFKAVAWVFGFVAVGVIIFTIFLLTKLLGPDSGPPFSKTSVSDINY